MLSASAEGPTPWGEDVDWLLGQSPGQREGEDGGDNSYTANNTLQTIFGSGVVVTDCPTQHKDAKLMEIRHRIRRAAQRAEGKLLHIEEYRNVLNYYCLGPAEAGTEVDFENTSSPIPVDEKLRKLLNKLWCFILDAPTGVAAEAPFHQLVATLYKAVFGNLISSRAAMYLAEDDCRVETDGHRSIDFRRFIVLIFEFTRIWMMDGNEGNGGHLVQQAKKLFTILVTLDHDLQVKHFKPLDQIRGCCSPRSFRPALGSSRSNIRLPVTRPQPPTTALSRVNTEHRRSLYSLDDHLSGRFRSPTALRPNTTSNAVSRRARRTSSRSGQQQQYLLDPGFERKRTANSSQESTEGMSITATKLERAEQKQERTTLETLLLLQPQNEDRDGADPSLEGRQSKTSTLWTKGPEPRIWQSSSKITLRRPHTIEGGGSTIVITGLSASSKLGNDTPTRRQQRFFQVDQRHRQVEAGQHEDEEAGRDNTQADAESPWQRPASAQQQHHTIPVAPLRTVNDGATASIESVASEARLPSAAEANVSTSSRQDQQGQQEAREGKPDDGSVEGSANRRSLPPCHPSYPGKQGRELTVVSLCIGDTEDDNKQVDNKQGEGMWGAWRRSKPVVSRGSSRQLVASDSESSLRRARSAPGIADGSRSPAMINGRGDVEASTGVESSAAGVEPLSLLQQQGGAATEPAPLVVGTAMLTARSSRTAFLDPNSGIREHGSYISRDGRSVDSRAVAHSCDGSEGRPEGTTSKLTGKKMQQGDKEVFYHGHHHRAPRLVPREHLDMLFARLNEDRPPCRKGAGQEGNFKTMTKLKRSRRQTKEMMALLSTAPLAPCETWVEVSKILKKRRGPQPRWYYSRSVHGAGLLPLDCRPSVLYL